MGGNKRMDRIDNLIKEFADDLFEALYGNANDPDGTPYKDTYIYETHNIFDELQDIVDLKRNLSLVSMTKKLKGLEYDLIGNIRIVSGNLDNEKLEVISEKIGRKMDILLA